MPTFYGIIIIWFLLLGRIRTMIMPPPWANPSNNPCASQPRGWQLLYWPSDGKCYKIFKIGAPCPETMELGPSAEGGGTVAECRCPPGTAQSSSNGLCYPIFTSASCPSGQYFAPVSFQPSEKIRWGVCRAPEICSKKGDIYWPRDGKCYSKFTRGPCQKGELITMEEDGLAFCSCTINGELGRYHWSGLGGGCYEHYTKGPCTEPGELFLPGGTCGCHNKLPHYHKPSGMCYQLGGIGPCLQGHHFTVTTSTERIDEQDIIHGECVCKSDHVLYKNGLCYRIHTRGPCDIGHMLVNATTCIQVPCKRGRLYFTEERTCYKIGTKGPCPNGQIVSYDYNVRPSIDGIGYNGVCTCTDVSKNLGKCEESNNNDCESAPGMILIDKTCYKLYTQGPCMEGEWLVPRRMPKDEDFWQDKPRPKVKCECRLGYERIIETSSSIELEKNSLFSPGICQPPTVGLAKFLNDRVRLGNLEQ